MNHTLLQDFPRSKFVTMACVLLDPHEMTARIALAGHPPPVLISGTPRLLKDAGGLPLGILDGDYAEEQIALSPGARLVLYSDGVLEAQSRDGEDYGSSGIQQHFQNPNASAESLLDHVREFGGGIPLEDDATVVTIQARTADSPEP